MMDLDTDPFEIESWEEYCKACISAGQLLMFRRKLNAYIKLTNKPVQNELQRYANQVHGEIVSDKILTKKHGNNYRSVIAEKK